MPQEIILDVSPEGDAKYEVRGVKGKGCLALAEFLKALGEVRDARPTAEMHARIDHGHQQKAGR